MNKLDLIEKEIASGYKNLTKEKMSNYFSEVLRAIGPAITKKVHSKTRSIYFRYCVVDSCEEKDYEYMNELSEEFLNKWNGSVELIPMTEDLTDIRSSEHLTAVMKIVVEVLKAHLLVEKALEIKRKKETT